MTNRKQTVSLRFFKAHAAALLNRTAKTGDPIFITVNGKARAVLQDVVL